MMLLSGYFSSMGAYAPMWVFKKNLEIPYQHFQSL